MYRPTTRRRDPPNQPTQPTLYVGDLSTNVTHDTLLEVFSQIGVVKSVHVQVDENNKPLGYAYINYMSRIDAESALKKLNYSTISGKQCRIMWKQNNEARKTGKGNIFVKNIDLAIDNKTLHQVFSKYGNILSCKVKYDEITNQSKGYGYIAFEHESAAQQAVQQMNGKQLCNKRLQVALFVPKEERIHQMENKPFTNVYVKYIPSTWNENTLISIFEKYTKGKITSSTYSTNVHGRHACLNFATWQQAKKAIKLLNRKQFRDINNSVTCLYVARAQKKKDRKYILKRNYFQPKLHVQRSEYGTNLCIKNLAWRVDNRSLFDLFCVFGVIKSCAVMRDHAGRSKGIGFVEFESRECAARALDELFNKMFYGKRISVSIAKPRGYKQSKSRMFKSMHPSFDIHPSFEKHPSHMVMKGKQLSSEEKNGSVAVVVDHEKKEEKKNDEDEEEKKEENLVIIWLRDEVGLKEYIYNFMENGFDDTEIVKDMNEHDLENIGINKIGHRRRILSYIKHLKTNTNDQKEGLNNHNV